MEYNTQKNYDTINEDLAEKLHLIKTINDAGLLVPFIQRDIDIHPESREHVLYILNVWDIARNLSIEKINPDTNESLITVIHGERETHLNNNRIETHVAHPPRMPSRSRRPPPSRSRGRTRSRASPQGANNNPSHRSRSPVRPSRTLEPPPHLSLGGKGHKRSKHKSRKNKTRRHK
jgi:hypothetical protein